MTPTIPSVVLNCGISMPRLGLGVWKMSEGEETTRAVAYALNQGYRLIDTATLYGNEKSVGRAVRASGIPREDIFVTTKLWPSAFPNPRQAFEESLSRLDIGYVDLYLIHWPVPFMGKRIWRTLENIYEEKLARAIGVSNYSEHQIGQLLEYARVTPAVNQVKFNPFSHDVGLLQFCKGRGIVIEAYTPLARGKVHHPVIERIAAAQRKTPPQVMIRWALQHDTVVIPKSSNPERIAENAAVFDFELSEDEMRALDELCE